MNRQRLEDELAREAIQSKALRTALLQLLEAAELARSSGRSAADFAIELPHLILAGSTAGAVKWLISNNLANHIAAGKQLSDRVSLAKRLLLSERSRFTLSAQGLALAEAVAQDQQAPATKAKSIKPRWKASDFELSYRGRLVMRLTPRAELQILVLEAFEEDHWCRRIDDPLPGGHLDPEKRLRNVVYRLKEALIEPLLDFHTDGSGRGVYWEPVNAERF